MDPNVIQGAVMLKFKKEPKIEVLAEYDDCSVRGNAVASGDDADDKKVEDEILRRLKDDDVWAWAAVTVRASIGELHGEDHLGCCSYESEEDFKKDGYYLDMVDGAKAELLKKIEEIVEYVESATESLPT